MSKTAETPTLEDLTPILAGDALPEAVDPEQASRDIVRRILESETVEDVLAQGGTTDAETVLGRPLIIKGYQARRSTLEDGPGMYFIVTATDAETGEALTITCGGRNVMGQLYRIGQLNGFPVQCKLEKSRRPTAAGYYPLWLERVAAQH